MNFWIIAYFMGWILEVEAVSMIVPMIISIVLHESDVWPWFLLLIVILAPVGFILSRKFFRRGNFFVREGYAATGLGWILLSVLGALPFFLSGRIPHFVDALFETASGFTTTGSSVLSDVEALGKGLLFWRSFTHWLGGMGVLVLILAILPMNGGYHMQFMKAESPGPSVSKMVPRVRDTAKVLYLIYIFMTLAMILTYVISGMPVFDAFCIGFGTAGTGGFSVRNSGMWDYGRASQILITIFMYLFGVNFNFYYLLIRKKWKDALKMEELRVYISIILVNLAVISLVTWRYNYQSEGYLYSLHHSAFTIGSLMSSTGFATVDFDKWPEIARLLAVLLMFVGACAGSTGGGLKVSRCLLLFKEARKEMHMLIHPQSIRPIKLEGKVVEHAILRSASNYFIIYVMIFVGAFILISFDGYDFTTNFTAVLATLNNIGPGLNLVGATQNFSIYSVPSKLVLSFCMLAGRLELLPMLMLLSPKTWTKHY